MQETPPGWSSFSSSTKPAIWYSVANTQLGNETQSDCDCDCDCACPTTTLDSLNMVEKENFLETWLLRQVRPLMIQDLSPGRYLVCHPLGEGHVAVLNEAALAILSEFAELRAVWQVIENLPLLLPSDVLSTVEQLLALRFIENQNSLPYIAESSSTVLSAWLHVTNACNLRCTYCYIKKSSEGMTEHTIRRSVEAVFRSAQANGFNQVKLKYAGGEPTLAISQIIDAHDYALRLSKEYKIALEAVLLSNGVFMPTSTIQKLLFRNIRVMISLDGLGMSHDVQRPLVSGLGSSERVLANIDQLLLNGLTPIISITLSNRNLDGIQKLIPFVLARDLPFSLNFYRENECSTNATDLSFSNERMIQALLAVFAEIEHQLPKRSLLGCLADRANLTGTHQHTCGVGHSYLVIDHFGGVSKCQMDIESPITTINDPDPLRWIRDDKLRVQNVSVEEKEGCRTCEWRYWCTGGCPLLTHRVTGRYDVKSPNCSIYKAIFPKILRLEGLRLLAHTSPWIPEKSV